MYHDRVYFETVQTSNINYTYFKGLNTMENTPLETSTVDTFIYARVSTTNQKIDSQVKDLIKYCEHKGWLNTKLYSEKMSGVAKRPIFEQMLLDCRSDRPSRVVVWDLSRLSRKGVSDAIQTITYFQDMDIDLISKKEGLDFNGQMGLVMASMLSAFANIDYQLRREKQALGIESAKEKNGGKCPWGGNKRKRDNSNDSIILKLKTAGMSIRKIATTINKSPQTIQIALKILKAEGKLAS
jgi:DNA invertase Pin-like site-specific DNA recombinase